MGQDKALLTLPNGQPLLARTAEVAQQLTDDVTIVTPWPDRYQSILPKNIRWVQEGRLPFLPPEEPPHSLSTHSPNTNPKPSAGPLSGFSQAWPHTTSDWCLLLACDLPYVQSDPLRQWWAWIVSNAPTQADGKGKADKMPSASLISADRRAADAQTIPTWEPLCGFYHRSCLPSLLHRVNAIESVAKVDASANSIPRSFQSWLQTLRIAAYSGFPSELLFNCNTPQDWAQVEDSSA